AVGQVGTILTTSDGGAHWSSQPSGTTRNLQSVTCPATRTCVAVGDGGTALVTTDGAHWVSRPAPTSSPLAAVSCARGSTACVAVGDGGTVLTTANLGTAWSTVDTAALLPPAAPGSAPDLLAVSCPTSAGCFAVGNLGPSGNVVALTRQGNTWKATVQNAGIRRLRSVSCATATACFAAGETGTVQVTSDGSTWAAPSGTESSVASDPGRNWLD